MLRLIRLGIKVYWPAVWSRVAYGVSREQRAFSWVMQNSKEGDPESVLAALDNYGQNVHFLMNVGDAKGPLLKGLLSKHKLKTVVELGGYLGYSAVLIANELPEGSRLISVEFDPFHAALADKLVDWAGLRSKVSVVIGDSGKIIPQLKDRFKLDHVDMVFIDHEKSLYVRDLKLLEQSGLLKPKKSIVVGDNILFPGAPDYLKYVTTSKEENTDKDRTWFYQTEKVMSHLEYSPEVEDMVTISHVL